MSDRRGHWERVYAATPEDEVSWYQARPVRSPALINASAHGKGAAIIDIGAGTSRLIEGLLAEGFRDLTALDISATALDRLRVRLGPAGAAVRFIDADITRWQPERTWDVWHDRAVFHFLTEPDDQAAYIAALGKALPPGGTAIIATFALDGPAKCSGLPVQRYSGETLAARLGAGFRLLSESREEHVTPRGAVQKFIYGVFERLP
ncbi:MAG TPA: class I SAM-dependent methyltransferase [Bauldia sp.]|nr:class I SAM-dependent methyltransferase [Bauldia sp.]